MSKSKKGAEHAQNMQKAAYLTKFTNSNSACLLRWFHINSIYMIATGTESVVFKETTEQLNNHLSCQNQNLDALVGQHTDS